MRPPRGPDGARRWRFGTIAYGALVISGQVTGTVSGTPNLRQYCLPVSGRVRIGS